MNDKKQIEKQAIEEMYKDVYEAINHNSVIDLINGGFIGVNTDGLTRELYDDGYRKQSEVIDEFANLLKEKLHSVPTVYKSHFGRLIDDVVKAMKGGAE